MLRWIQINGGRGDEKEMGKKNCSARDDALRRYYVKP
jgi:hypothetical protein